MFYEIPNIKQYSFIDNFLPEFRLERYKKKKKEKKFSKDRRFRLSLKIIEMLCD